MTIENTFLTLIQAWDELNKINNRIELLETIICARKRISASKLREILVECSFTNNDKFINSIIANDKDTVELREKYSARNGYENYIYKEMERLKLSEPVLCVAFLKEYKRLTWDKISKELNFSNAQCRRYYDEYKEKSKGSTPYDNTWNLPKNEK